MTGLKTRGFTIIETLLYFALFAIIAGGGLASAAGIISATTRSADRVAVVEEASFLSAKTRWLLSGGGVIRPATGTAEFLEVQKPGLGIIRLERIGPDAVLARPDASNALNGGGVRVTALEFERDNPETVTARFTLSSSSTGRVVSQDFQLTRSLWP